MILKNNLYIVKSADAGSRAFEIELLRDCFIYMAHFPEQPITPGVCIIQIAGELLADLMGRDIELASVNNAKFLSVIDPTVTSNVTYTFKKVEPLADDTLKVSVVVADDEVTYSKLSLLYRNK